MIDPAASPQSWQDLLDAKYKSNMFLTDPRANDTTLTFPATLREVLGDDYLRALGKQDLALVPVTSQGVEQVIAGERAVVFPCNPGNLEKFAGQGVIELNQVEYPSWTSYFASIPSQAPHPEAAREFLNFLMSVEGQTILCEGVSVSPLDDIPGSLPKPKGRMVDVSIQDALAEKDEIFDLLGLPA
jgi:ABC-type Fe3+ transport system substrate-binding protein